MSPIDGDLIDRFLAATSDLPQTEVARRAGVGQNTVSRWRGGDRRPLRSRTRQALEDYLGGSAEGVSGRSGEALSPAEQLIFALEHPGVRSISGPASEADKVKAAYAVAFDMRLSSEEMGKLDAWRDEKLQRAQQNATADQPSKH